MHLSRPPNVHVHKQTTVIKHDLHDDRKVSLSIIIIRCTLIWTYYRKCVPSIAPAACGKPQIVSDPLKICFKCSPSGILTYWGSRCETIARQVCTTIFPTVERPRPNNCDKVMYSMFVTNFQTVIATLSSTDTGNRN